MKPGRKLDALVAEKVMGLFTKHDKDRLMAQYLVAENKENFGKYRKLLTPAGTMSIELAKPLPHYSTEISAAWEVVEKLESKGFRYMMSNTRFDGIPTYDYLASIGYNEPWVAIGKPFEKVVPFIGKSIPHAVCLAALNAVGFEETE